MQRIINDPDMLVEDMLPGFLEANKEIVHRSEANPRTVVSNFCGGEPRVGIVTGGGSGHWPAFIGYCGQNMVDAVAVGEIFSSPTAKAFEQCVVEADQGKGIKFPRWTRGYLTYVLPVLIIVVLIGGWAPVISTWLGFA